MPSQLNGRINPEILPDVAKVRFVNRVHNIQPALLRSHFATSPRSIPLVPTSPGCAASRRALQVIDLPNSKFPHSPYEANHP